MYLLHMHFLSVDTLRNRLYFELCESQTHRLSVVKVLICCTSHRNSACLLLVFALSHSALTAFSILLWLSHHHADSLYYFSECGRKMLPLQKNPSSLSRSSKSCFHIYLYRFHSKISLLQIQFEPKMKSRALFFTCI